MATFVHCECGCHFSIKDNEIVEPAACPLCGKSAVPAQSSGVDGVAKRPRRRLASVRYWLLAPALIPLIWMSMTRDVEDAVGNRIVRTLSQLSEEQQMRVARAMLKGDLDGVYALLPEHRFIGAWLPRESTDHWLFALGSAVIFLGLMCAMFQEDNADWVLLLRVGAVTGTIGVLFLLIFHTAVDFFMMLPTTILFFKIFEVLHRSVFDASYEFMPSLFGFVFGVGLVEEFCKFIPLSSRFGKRTDFSWREACVWGLASGAGFGISEGIMHAGSMYNGLMPQQIYTVRFVSCVALHAIWSATVGVTLWQRRGPSSEFASNTERFLRTLRIIAVPMVLHGLYDTLLKCERERDAVIVAILTFFWLGWKIEEARRQEFDEPEVLPEASHS